jgi:hypothetical protein
MKMKGQGYTKESLNQNIYLMNSKLLSSDPNKTSRSRKSNSIISGQKSNLVTQGINRSLILEKTDIKGLNKELSTSSSSGFGNLQNLQNLNISQIQRTSNHLSQLNQMNNLNQQKNKVHPLNSSMTSGNSGEKFTNINIIFNNNFIKSVNDTNRTNSNNYQGPKSSIPSQYEPKKNNKSFQSGGKGVTNVTNKINHNISHVNHVGHINPINPLNLHPSNGIQKKIPNTTSRDKNYNNSSNISYVNKHPTGLHGLGNLQVNLLKGNNNHNQVNHNIQNSHNIHNNTKLNIHNTSINDKIKSEILNHNSSALKNFKSTAAQSNLTSNSTSNSNRYINYSQNNSNHMNNPNQVNFSNFNHIPNNGNNANYNNTSMLNSSISANQNNQKIKTLKDLKISARKNSQNMTRNSQNTQNSLKHSKDSSFMDYTSNTHTSKISPIGVERNNENSDSHFYGNLNKISQLSQISQYNNNTRTSVSPHFNSKQSTTFIQNSYSQLSKQLKQNKPNSVRTSFQRSSNLIINQLQEIQENASLAMPVNSGFKKEEVNFMNITETSLPIAQKKTLVKSFEIQEINDKKFDRLHNLDKSHNFDKSNNFDKSHNLDKLDSSSISEDKFFNPKKSTTSLIMSANSTNRNNQNSIRLVKSSNQSVVSFNDIPLSKDEKFPKESSLVYYRGSALRENVEGPEELHFMHVNLNSKQKLFVYKLEETSGNDCFLDNSVEL